MGMASKLWMHAKMLRFDRIAFDEHGQSAELCFEQPWTPNSKHLDGFLEICPGWRYPDILPPTYPQVALAELHSKILADRRFPFNPMGIVHVSNHVQVHRPISMTNVPTFDVRVSLVNFISSLV